MSPSSSSQSSASTMSSLAGLPTTSCEIASNAESDYIRFQAGIHGLGLDLDDTETAVVLDILLALPKRDRLQCHFNTLHLEAKILQAVAIVQNSSRRGGY